MSPNEYCQQRGARTGSSLYYSTRFLPPEKRAALAVLHAFCRELGDVARECSDPNVAHAKLHWWREEVARLFDDRPRHPVTCAFTAQRAQFDCHPEYLHEIIDGAQMDVDYDAYPSFSELRLYCQRTAGVVGMLSAEICGYEDRGTLRCATELAIGRKLVNLLRDVREHALRGRVYLPQDELRRFGVVPDQLQLRQTTDNASNLFRFQAVRADETLESALTLLPDIDRKKQTFGLIIGRLYRDLLKEMEAENFQLLERRVHLTPLRKLWLAWRIQRTEAGRARNEPR